VPVTSDTPIEAALEPVKLFEGICKGGCNIGSRFAVQTLCLDKPGASSGIPEGTSQVPCALGVVVRALPAGSVASCNRQSSESDVVHDHVRFRQHQVAVIACVVVGIAPGTWSTRPRPRTAKLWAARRAAVSSARVGARPR
jgi:hypothetical protein